MPQISVNTCIFSSSITQLRPICVFGGRAEEEVFRFEVCVHKGWLEEGGRKRRRHKNDRRRMHRKRRRMK
jgi:hypothetical protein